MKTRSEIAEQVSKNEETVRLFKDGNQMCALIGDNIQEGPCGFGETVGDALRELAQTCDCKEFVHEPAAPVSPPQSIPKKQAHQLLTELNNYALRHQKVIDASWIAKVIEQVREEIGE